MMFSINIAAQSEFIPLTETYYRAKVLNVEDLPPPTGQKFFEQKVEIKFTDNVLKGKEIVIKNHYYQDQPMSIYVEEGMNLIIVAMGEGDEKQYYIQDLAREQGLLYLLILSALFLLIIGRFKGLKTIISLALTGFLIFYYLLPQLLAGKNPVFLSVIIAGIVIIVSLILISGFNVKTLAAIVGTIVGVIFAGILTLWIGNISHLTGFGSSEAQMLSYLDYNIDVRGILFAGIIIGSLGAITDVGISVASAALEIKEASPLINFRKLFAGAINVGRDVMGTMANTLILAYVGAATPLILLMMAHNIAWLKIINMDLIATEIVRGLVGVIGLAAAVPVTALISGFLMVRR